MHADINGATSIVVRNAMTPDSIIPPSTLSQAGTLAMASSNAWDSKAVMSAWWVNADQISKLASNGEFLPIGSFMVRGKKNFLPPAQLLLGFGVMFRISEESKARHIKHRIQNESTSIDGSEIDKSLVEETLQEGSLQEAEDENAEESGGHEEASSDEDEDTGTGHGSTLNSPEHEKHLNDESPSVHCPVPADKEEVSNSNVPDFTVDGLDNLKIDNFDPSKERGKETRTDSDTEGLGSKDDISMTAPQSKKKVASPLPRGKRSKAKKIATKYKDQDEEDRRAAEMLIGATLGREKAAAETKAKAQREAEAAFQKERRRAQHQRNLEKTAEHEELRKKMLEEGAEIPDDEGDKSVSLDVFVGTPLPGDEIIDALPVCAPWAAMGKYKYKAKLQPGTQKKGKAVKEILDKWILASSGKGSMDFDSRDTEKMWPSEVELLKGWKAEECINCVPVGKVKVTMSGGSSAASGKGASVKGKGGKASKKQR